MLYVERWKAFDNLLGRLPLITDEFEHITISVFHEATVLDRSRPGAASRSSQYLRVVELPAIREHVRMRVGRQRELPPADVARDLDPRAARWWSRLIRRCRKSCGLNTGMTVRWSVNPRRAGRERALREVGPPAAVETASHMRGGSHMEAYPMPTAHASMSMTL